MPAALSRALAALSGIYKFPGTRSAPHAIELDVPVQLVHDVSREAELAAGFWAQASVILTTAGAGADTFASTLRDDFLGTTENQQLLRELGLTTGEVDVWLYGWHALLAAADSGDFSRLRLGIRVGTLIGTGVVQQLVTYVAAQTAMVTGGALPLVTSTTGAELSTYGEQRLPILMQDRPDTAFLAQGNDDAGGDMTVTGFFRCWVGPKGSPPPL